MHQYNLYQLIYNLLKCHLYIQPVSWSITIGSFIDIIYILLQLHTVVYRSKHGTESALIKVKNDIMFSLNSNKVVFVVLLDLSAAFDVIDHRIFIVRLSERIGVRGTALNWFRSYLEDWSTQVDIDGELSDPAISRFGLPQGSVVGPIGFTAYILPVGDIARYHNVSYHVYADDIQLY